MTQRLVSSGNCLGVFLCSYTLCALCEYIFGHIGSFKAHNLKYSAENHGSKETHQPAFHRQNCGQTKIGPKILQGKFKQSYISLTFNLAQCFALTVRTLEVQLNAIHGGYADGVMIG